MVETIKKELQTFTCISKWEITLLQNLSTYEQFTQCCKINRKCLQYLGIAAIVTTHWLYLMCMKNSDWFHYVCHSKEIFLFGFQNKGAFQKALKLKWHFGNFNWIVMKEYLYSLCFCDVRCFLSSLCLCGLELESLPCVPSLVTVGQIIFGIKSLMLCTSILQHCTMSLFLQIRWHILTAKLYNVKSSHLK